MSEVGGPYHLGHSAGGFAQFLSSFVRSTFSSEGLSVSSFNVYVLKVKVGTTLSRMDGKGYGKVVDRKL